MNTDSMIPVSYVRSIIPLSIGDVIYRKSTDEVSRIDTAALRDNLNQHDSDVEGFLVASFAERANTGKRPVAALYESLLTCTRNDGSEAFLPESWVLLPNNAKGIRTWKPDVDVMLGYYSMHLKVLDNQKTDNVEPEDGGLTDLQIIAEVAKISGVSHYECDGKVLTKLFDKPCVFNPITDNHINLSLRDECEVVIDYEGREVSIYDYLEEEYLAIATVSYNTKGGINRAVCLAIVEANNVRTNNKL